MGTFGFPYEVFQKDFLLLYRDFQSGFPSLAPSCAALDRFRCGSEHPSILSFPLFGGLTWQRNTSKLT